MPIYEYLCPKCNAEKEILQKISDSPPLCCDTLMLKQLSKSGTFILKGGGWFADGYSKVPKGKKK